MSADKNDALENETDVRSNRDRRADEKDAARAPSGEARNYVRDRYEAPAPPVSRSHVLCRDIMTRDVTVATRETSLNDVAAMMRDEDTGVIPVVERSPGEVTDEALKGTQNKTAAKNYGRLVGLVTDRDIVIRALADGKEPKTTRVEGVMTTDIHTAQPNDRVIDTIRKMGDKQVRRIPVVDEDNNLRGIISMADVALETEEDRELAEALEEISSGTSFWSKVT
jgi:CBS domain-containing protein